MASTDPAPSEPPSGQQPSRATTTASTLFGALMILAAVLVITDALRLPSTSGTLGPAAVPLPVGVLLGVVGAGIVIQARAQAAHAVPTERGGQLWRVVALVGVLVAFAALLQPLGYLVSTAGLFTAAALLLGAPRHPRTFAYGWALAAIVFLVFDRLIGLTLPTGPWGF